MSHTKVLFLKDADSEEVTAYFPEIPWDTSERFIACYAHVGQHGGADLSAVKEMEAQATPDEYERLKRELESIGYKLEVLG